MVLCDTNESSSVYNSFLHSENADTYLSKVQSRGGGSREGPIMRTHLDRHGQDDRDEGKSVGVCVGREGEKSVRDI